MNQAVDLDELTLFAIWHVVPLKRKFRPTTRSGNTTTWCLASSGIPSDKLGYCASDVDEAYGGAGTTPHVTLAMIEELSRMGFGGFASGYGIHSNIIAPYLSRHGTEAQKAHWLPAHGDR